MGAAPRRDFLCPSPGSLHFAQLSLNVPAGSLAVVLNHGRKLASVVTVWYLPGRAPYSPAMVISSMSQDPVLVLPGKSQSLPTAIRPWYICLRLPAMVISSTG